MLQIKMYRLISVSGFDMSVRLFFLFSGLVFASILNAQEYKTSMGLRAGLPVGITARHFLNKEYAVEGILASRWGGFVMMGCLEREYCNRDYPGFGWFWGGGIHLGIWNEGYNPRLRHGYSGAAAGIDGIAGIEYTFDELPLEISVDVVPSVNLAGSAGWGGINGALSIRYVF